MPTRNDYRRSREELVEMGILEKRWEFDLRTKTMCWRYYITEKGRNLPVDDDPEEERLYQEKLAAERARNGLKVPRHRLGRRRIRGLHR